MKGQDWQWLQSFLEGMDNDMKIHTLSALVFMDKHDEQAHDNDERVFGKDISFDNILTVAAEALSGLKPECHDAMMHHA